MGVTSRICPCSRLHATQTKHQWSITKDVVKFKNGEKAVQVSQRVHWTQTLILIDSESE